ncbi:MAG TPA: AAA family ATPase, partial [Gemmatimonadota bacterium]|nr:AAA family ATPase [Gemmatimonadota bacterium]
MSVSGPFSIVFANAKGGVGKTTSAVHVAGAFAQSGVETLIVDLDPQASATRHVGLDPAALETTLTDVLIDPSRGIAPAVRPTRYPNLSILPAHESLGTLESELGSMPDRESLLSAAWSGDLPFRVAVFDVPP